MPTIYLVKSGVAFDAAPDETIMEAAERNNIFLAHSCLSGICRACMTRVLSGVVEHDPEYAAYLNIDPFEIQEGYRLLCNAFARTDVELDR